MKASTAMFEARNVLKCREPALRGCGMFGRFPKSNLRVTTGPWFSTGLRWSSLCLPVAAYAQTTNDIPRLRPAYPELPPTFWDQYGGWVVVLGVVLLALVAFSVWLLLRPKPAVIVPIEVQAREELEILRKQSEDGRTLSQVSRCLRRYMAVAFHLPTDELTTAEFCRAIGNQSEIDVDLASALREFLRRCDELKFAPAQPSPPFGAAEHALNLVERGEACRAQARQAAATREVDRSGETP